MKSAWRTKDVLPRADQAGQRALWKSMGYTDEDLKRPLIGVHNTWSETCPGHFNLKTVTESVKAGIWQAGGTPMEFLDFSQCPPITAGTKGVLYDSPTRDLIAACAEACTELHMFDGVVLISSCDKIVPGHWLAAARLNLPAILVSGGPMKGGIYKGKRLDSTDMISEGHAVELGFSKHTIAELKEMEDCACPGWGSCALLGTANTTQCLSEVAGLTLPGGGTAPAVSAKRLWLAKESGRQIVELVHKGIRASDILTKQAIENMIIIQHAIGGSTNAVIHLLALIEELGFGDDLNIDTIDRWGAKIPCILNVQPGGEFDIWDFDEAGGMQALMKRVEKYLDLNCLTVNGKTMGENLRETKIENPEVIRELNKPLYANGLAVLRGNLATSAIVRPPVIPQKMLKMTGPARVFDSEMEALDALKNKTIKPNTVIIVRYEGPRGAPGLRELFMTTYYLKAAGLDQSCAIVADGKFSGFAKGPFICQVTPEAAVGGPIAVVKDNDLIEIDIPNKQLNIKVSEEELSKRLAEWKPKAPKVRSGILTLYARMANSCAEGAGLPLKI